MEWINKKDGIHIRMKRQDFYYELPEELIAQDPLEDRSGSRLLVLDRESGAVSHHVFREILEFDFFNGGITKSLFLSRGDKMDEKQV